MAKKFQTKKTAKRSQLAERVLRLRKAFGWSQARLAEEFYITPATVAHWESDKRDISGAAIKLIEIYESKLNGQKENQREKQQ